MFIRYPSENVYINVIFKQVIGSRFAVAAKHTPGTMYNTVLSYRAFRINKTKKKTFRVYVQNIIRTFG